MTHLNLAFATATSSNGWDLGASDAEVDALVAAAHAAGVRVLASLGGGGGDQTVVARYKTSSNVAPLVASLVAIVDARHLDGVDVDIEDPSNLGANYSAFVDATVSALRPKSKLVTAAVAQYLQDSMSDDTLRSFDFLNVMIYSNESDSTAAMSYYADTKSIARDKLTLGAGFFGTDSAGNEYAYKDVLAADGNAWSKDVATVNGQTVHYSGVDTMKKLVTDGKAYGGIMFWELSEDAPGPHSLYAAIQSVM
jgi:chitinase